MPQDSDRRLPKLTVLFFLGDSSTDAEADLVAQEQETFQDLVLLPGLEEKFSEIWLKTISVLTFASRWFKRNRATGKAPPEGIRYLLKADDDAMLNIPEILDDLFIRKDVRVGVYWGYVMMAVKPVRDPLDKYFVPTSAYDHQYYPLYVRGMSYALSEDLVVPVGNMLESGEIPPFPYREDVGVGMYISEIAKRGLSRIWPKQRSLNMPLDFPEWCATPFGRGGETPILVLHRYPLELTDCLWDKIMTNQYDLCNCYHIVGVEYPKCIKCEVGSGTYHDGSVTLQYSGIKPDENKTLSTQPRGKIEINNIHTLEPMSIGNFGASAPLMKIPVINK